MLTQLSQNLLLRYDMPSKIKRIEASEEQVQASNNRLLGGDLRVLPANLTLQVSYIGQRAHQFENDNGELQESVNSKLVIELKGRDRPIYVSNLIGNRTDRYGNTVEHVGSLNKLVNESLGMTESEFTEKIRNIKALKTCVVRYDDYNDKGKEAKISYNEWDIVE